MKRGSSPIDWERIKKEATINEIPEVYLDVAIGHGKKWEIAMAPDDLDGLYVSDFEALAFVTGFLVGYKIAKDQEIF